MSSTILNDIVRDYEAISTSWFSALGPIANKIFWILVAIQLTWSAIWWVIDREDGLAVVSSLLRQVVDEQIVSPVIEMDEGPRPFHKCRQDAIEVPDDALAQCLATRRQRFSKRFQKQLPSLTNSLWRERQHLQLLFDGWHPRQRLKLLAVPPLSVQRGNGLHGGEHLGAAHADHLIACGESFQVFHDQD